MHLRCLLAFLFVSRTVDACWYQSKDPAMRAIETFMHKIKRNIDNGVSRKDLNSVVKNAPSPVGWLIQKIDGVEGILHDCDTNSDGVIYKDEALNAVNCGDSCWKQIAVQTFLF